MLIDTHCHLDASEFDQDREAVVRAAQDSGVRHLVIPAIHCANFSRVAELAGRYTGCVYALGIHPLYVQRSTAQDLLTLERLLAAGGMVAVGEIGLDFFVAGHDRALQEQFFVRQLELARDFDLPVILHVRRSIDIILKYLRRFRVSGGIAHAFNGSEQQAHEFIKLGFKLGFGGAMTYARALKIRRLARDLPLEAIVLETDAPDIPPAWLPARSRNSPAQLPKIAAELARIRELETELVVAVTAANVRVALPRLGILMHTT